MFRGAIDYSCTKAELRSKKKSLLERQIRRAQVRINAKERKRDTRRKILAGACVLDRAAKDPDSARHLKEILDAFLERERDRALFDLPPRQDSNQSAINTNKETDNA